MALTDFLTQIADSIRSKDGTTEPIVALDFPQRILDIPSGGGISGFYVAQGSFVLSNTHTLYHDGAEDNFTFEHGLGKKPDVVIIYSFDGSSDGSRQTNSISLAAMMPLYASTNYASGISYHKIIYRINSSSNALSQGSYDDKKLIDVTESSVIVGKGISTSQMFKFIGGKKYEWLVLARKEESV